MLEMYCDEIKLNKNIKIQIVDVVLILFSSFCWIWERVLLNIFY